MVEIALSLAIIGFALVAIIGVLPYGMNTQRDNREDTIINQDATVLIEAVRNAAIGSDNLTNYVLAITNTWTLYNPDGTTNKYGINGYAFNANPSVTSGVYPASPYPAVFMIDGASIVGLLSTPEFIANTFPATNYPAVNSVLAAYQQYGVGCYSNRIIATVRTISGVAAEKPPQDNQLLRDDTLTFRLVCVNAPISVDTNTFNPSSRSSFAAQLAANQRELRMTFLWPVMPNGKVLNNGSSPLTYRVTIAGQLALTNYFGQHYYLYQPQTYTNVP
jgi:type II secretory pathway pseudopilin PulG